MVILPVPPRIIETLRSRLVHFTANNKLQLAVNSFTLPVCPYLGLKICGWLLVAAMFVFIHESTLFYLAEKLSSKLHFFKIKFDNQ